MEAFNLDSGVTQPQLSPAAAAVIVPRLRANENPPEENETCCCLQENGTYLLNDQNEGPTLSCFWYDVYLNLKMMQDEPDSPTETFCALQRR